MGVRQLPASSHAPTAGLPPPPAPAPAEQKIPGRPDAGRSLAATAARVVCPPRARAGGRRCPTASGPRRRLSAPSSWTISRAAGATGARRWCSSAWPWTRWAEGGGQRQCWCCWGQGGRVAPASCVCIVPCAVCAVHSTGCPSSPRSGGRNAATAVPTRDGTVRGARAASEDGARARGHGLAGQDLRAAGPSTVDRGGDGQVR